MGKKWHPANVPLYKPTHWLKRLAANGIDSLSQVKREVCAFSVMHPLSILHGYCWDQSAKSSTCWMGIRLKWSLYIPSPPRNQHWDRPLRSALATFHTLREAPWHPIAFWSVMRCCPPGTERHKAARSATAASGTWVASNFGVIPCYALLYPAIPCFTLLYHVVPHFQTRHDTPMCQLALTYPHSFSCLFLMAKLPVKPSPHPTSPNGTPSRRCSCEATRFPKHMRICSCCSSLGSITYS